jgi:hypothetical protein
LGRQAVPATRWKSKAIEVPQDGLRTALKVFKSFAFRPTDLALDTISVKSAKQILYSRAEVQGMETKSLGWLQLRN